MLRRERYFLSSVRIRIRRFLQPAFHFVRNAAMDAVVSLLSKYRKIVLVGTISDYTGRSSPKYARIAKQARAISDYVFFVGHWAPCCMSARTHGSDQSIQAFETVQKLGDYLCSFLRPADFSEGKYFPGGNSI